MSSLFVAGTTVARLTMGSEEQAEARRSRSGVFFLFKPALQPVDIWEQ